MTAMRIAAFPALAALVFSTACIAADPVAAPPVSDRTFALTATVNESSQCTAAVMDKSYKSVGKIRGDLPSKFIGTVAERNYHGFGCVVDNTAGEGDLIIIFSGNRFGQPLAVGTYRLVSEIIDSTPAMSANVTFKAPGIGGERLSTFDGARGSVVVDSAADGSRRIRADVDVYLYSHRLF